MKPALFHHLADRELAEAIQFYEDRVPGLGSRFRDLFILAVAHHKRRPNYWIDRLK